MVKRSSFKWVIYTFLILWIVMYASISIMLTILSILRMLLPQLGANIDVAFIKILLPEMNNIPSILSFFTPIFATIFSISFLIAGFIMNRRHRYACCYIAEALKKRCDHLD
ncbi:MAG: hypothetical protein QW374_02930 [Candidatus Bathyarchaeia archaeon]|nr:hypothetical protein [Candidatus Bathyarchaeota archaeon]